MAKMKSVAENTGWSIGKLEKKRQTKKESFGQGLSNAIKNMRTEEERKPRLPPYWDGRVIKVLG